MIKIDIISGFLGAGKTTLIKKLFEGAFKKEKIALIENEFGEIGIDGAFLKNSGIEIKEINSGCICCSLVGNFEKSLTELIERYNPDRIIIEPSGVGKLSEVVRAVEGVDKNVKLNVLCTVVDGGKYKMYFKNFGEFYVDQITEANTVVVSKTENLSEQKLIDVCEFIKNYNPTATIITTPIDKLNGTLLLDSLEDNVSLVDVIIKELKEKNAGHHHHHEEECHCHDHHHEEECHCHDHHHEEECHCHDHHHEEECHCHDHHHEEECHCHDHHHEEECHCHDHHHAEEVFDSWGIETPVSYKKDELDAILKELSTEKYGIVLRSKGIVKGADIENWYYFDYVLGDYEIRQGDANIIGKLCVIGNNIDKVSLNSLFNKRG